VLNNAGVSSTSGEVPVGFLVSSVLPSDLTKALKHCSGGKRRSVVLDPAPAALLRARPWRALRAAGAFGASRPLRGLLAACLASAPAPLARTR
jgi:hypothetical protein